MPPKIKKIFSKRLEILSLILIIGIPIWLNLPGMTEDMAVRPLFYLWSTGLFPLNTTIYNDFTRDYEYRSTLKGKPIDVLIPLFYELKNISEHRSDSYVYESVMGRNSKRIYRSNNRPIALNDIYCIESNKNQGNMCVMLRDDKIEEFWFIKG